MNRIRLFIFTFLFCGILWLANGTDAKAAVTIASDGTWFDPDWYAATYPDAVAEVGSDGNKLLQHYLTKGTTLGYLPYETYGQGVSPLIGTADIPLATESVVEINYKDPVLLNYMRNSVHMHWADNDYGSYYKYQGYTDADLGLNISDRYIIYLAVPSLVAEPPYMVPATIVSMESWSITRSENGSTWNVKLDKRFDWNPDGGYRISSEEWDILRNMLRYLSPDGEALFKNIVSGYYLGYSPASYDYGNFHNLGSSLFMIADDGGCDFYFRANDSALDMETLHNTVASQTAAVPVTAVKRTSIDVNDPYLLAFKEAYDSINIIKKSGMTTYNPKCHDTYFALDLGNYLLFDDGISSASIYLAQDTWVLEYNMASERYNTFPDSLNNCWGLEIQGWIDEMECDAIRQSLNYVTPDAEALYNKIMENETNGSLKLNTWLKVGNSQLYVYKFWDDYEGSDNFYIYFFK